MVKNLPANAGDTGSSPGPGRSHMPRSNKGRAGNANQHYKEVVSLCSRAHEPQLLSPHATTTELEPVFSNKRSHHNEKPTHPNEE